MTTHAKDWKFAVERLWTARTIDFRAAAQLAAEIARESNDPTLRQAAAQALPFLRGAALKGADRRTRELAQRRLGDIRNVLHALTAPRFGRRGIAAEPLTADERYRRMLGLPSGRRLFGPEIKEAYKRAAKTMHPDTGGSEQAFRELSAARDALMKGG